ncbi:MAG TPA: F0F1 ATP synthase subunit A [Candidatus Limnocylindrales bacterium]|nr:F0F1 ATP synthase subunit A [Candidatus Limnocylindrales bacterium]
MSSDQKRPIDGNPARAVEATEANDIAGAPAAAAEQPDATKRKGRPVFRILIPAVIVLDILAFMFVPPYAGEPGKPVGGISDLINANLEALTPHILFPAGKAGPAGIVSFDPSITNTLFTMWIVMAFILVLVLLARMGMSLVPGRLQNAVEFAWEALENWAVSLGGENARRHIPLFAAFFLFILFSNWSGLLPFFGRIEALRAPTSDVNVTLGLALVVFGYFQFQGFRALGIRSYLGKFFPLGAFRNGIGAGLIALYVGLIEFLLEFIKPVTLAMRLFGNIFGGEVALGVITALTIALIPAAMLLLEGLLNFVQALIFSTLMLMYTIIAVETHDDAGHTEEGIPEGNIGPPIPNAQPAH